MKSLATTCAEMLASVMILAGASAAQQPSAGGGAGATNQAPPLQMCLGTAADFSAVYPTDIFPAGVKEVSCVFTLDAATAFTTLTSKWIAVDVADAAGPNTEIASHDLALTGRKVGTGALRYSQENPLPKGAYRLDVLGDGKPWQSVKFRVIDAPAHPTIKSAAELMPLSPGHWWSYETSLWGSKVTQDGSASPVGPDGKIHGNLLALVAAPDARGVPTKYYFEGEQAFTVWMKVADNGLTITAGGAGNNITEHNPPALIWPFPPQNFMTWQQARADGPPAEFRIWGPLPMLNGRAAGYVVLTTRKESFGTDSAEIHLVPGIGIVRQKRIAAGDGSVIEAHDWTLEPLYDIVPDEELKGRFGRIVVKFPKDGDGKETYVGLYKADDPENRIEGGYGDLSKELLPGQYFVEINSSRVGPVEVKPRNNSVIHCGIIRVNAGKETYSTIYRAFGTDKVTGFYGSREAGLPIGPYEIEVSGQREIVIIMNGKVTEF